LKHIMATSFQVVMYYDQSDKHSQGNVHVDRDLPLDFRVNAGIHYARMCVMSNNENLEKAGFCIVCKNCRASNNRASSPRLPHLHATVQALQEPGAWSRREKVRYCTVSVLREVMITIGGVAAAKILSSRLFWRA
ncbi:hypothetical protein LB503_007345, partial [Fusarium chuoi]